METLFLALRVLVALGAVLGLIWFVQRKMMRGAEKSATANRVGGGAKRPIQVLGNHRLTPKASITVVEIDGVRLVLGVTEHGISVLTPAPRPPAVPASTPVVATIADPPAIGSESDPTQVAAPAEDTVASAGAEPSIDFAAVLRETLDEAPAAPAISTVVEVDPAGSEQRVMPRRRRTLMPFVRDQLVPGLARTLAGALGIRVTGQSSVPHRPATASTPPAQAQQLSAASALAAFRDNSAPVEKRDYSQAVPLAERLQVLQRAS